MSKIFARASRVTAAALLAAGLTSPLAAHAQPQAPVVNTTVGLQNVDGSFSCDHSTIDGKTHILCHVPVARASMPECNPPNELVPAFKYYDGKSHAQCWNQGRVAESYRTLKPWMPHLAGDVLILPTGDKGFHFLSLRGYHGYAGPNGVSDSSGLVKLSSRLF